MTFKITNIQIAKYIEEQRMPTLQELANSLCDDKDMEYVITKDRETASLLPIIDTKGHESIYTKLKEISIRI